MTDITYQCTCGACSVKASGAPSMQLYCHCDDCQAAYGAPYTGRAIYPKGSVEVLSGETRSWTYKTNSRTFCTNCGVNLFSEPANGQFVACNASLLPAGFFKPQGHIQCQSALLPIQDALPHYRVWPAGFPGSDGALVGW